MDTIGEFPQATDQPEPGEDGGSGQRESRFPDGRGEFANSRLCRLAAPGMMKIRWCCGGARCTGHLRAPLYGYPRSFGEGGVVGTSRSYFRSSISNGTGNQCKRLMTGSPSNCRTGLVAIYAGAQSKRMNKRAPPSNSLMRVGSGKRAIRGGGTNS